MASWTITDTGNTITVTRDSDSFEIQKARVSLTVTEPILYLFFRQNKKGGARNLFEIPYTACTSPAEANATNLQTTVQGYLDAFTGGGVGLTDGDYGDVIVGGTGTTMTIDSNAVTFSKMQAVSANVLLGNDATGTAVEEITCTPFARTILDDTTAAAVRSTIGAGTGNGDALTSNPLSQFAATTSAQLRGVLSDELGTGAALFDGATPTSFVLTNATGLPVAGGGTGASTKFAALNNLGVTTLRMTTGTQTTTNATATSITDLVMTLAANSFYTFDGMLQIGCDNTGGVVLTATIPSGGIFFQGFGFSTNGGAHNSGMTNVSGTLTPTTRAWCTVNSANGYVWIKGTVTTAGSGGSLQFKFASAVAGQTSSIFTEGTFITVIHAA